MRVIARAPVNRRAKWRGLVLCGIAGLSAMWPTAGPGQATNFTAAALSAPRREWASSLRWENDAFGGTDRFYTDGASIALAHTGPSWLDPVANGLPWEAGRRTVTYDLTQVMITPADTTLVNPDPADRPYAGILTAGLTLHLDRTNNYHGLKVIAGVVGPWSMAEETQRAVHALLGNDYPKGWDYQLHNEPVLDLGYEYRHKFRLAGQQEGWAVEALPLGGGWLGNLLIQAQGGGMVRMGYNIPQDFGPTLIRAMGNLPPPRHGDNPKWNSDWGFAIYGGGLVNLVLRDLTLDGNTIKDSRSVEKNIFVPMAGVGISVGNRHVQTSFTYVLWGEEFEAQQEYSKFGAITVSYLF